MKNLLFSIVAVLAVTYASGQIALNENLNYSGTELETQAGGGI